MILRQLELGEVLQAIMDDREEKLWWKVGNSTIVNKKGNIMPRINELKSRVWFLEEEETE